jgi:hypothetical protein
LQLECLERGIPAAILASGASRIRGWGLNMKLQFTRDFYMPKSHTAIVKAKNAPAIVYLYGGGSLKLGAVGFFGKAEKPSFHYTFRDEQRRADYVAAFIKSSQERVARKEQRKAEKRAFRHTLKVGDVLRCSWGYDQTNIEYFQVTDLVGKAMVAVRAIAQETEDTGFMCGKCVPVPGRFVGEPMRKRVTEGNAVMIHSFAHAYPIEMKEVAPGVRVADASYWSSYA